MYTCATRTENIFIGVCSVRSGRRLLQRNVFYQARLIQTFNLLFFLSAIDGVIKLVEVPAAGIEVTVIMHGKMLSS